MVLGTPLYASPEQLVDAKSVKEPTDVFALGATFYFLLTGEPPFPHKSGTLHTYLMERQASKPEPLLNVLERKGLPACPSDLANLCHRCLVSVEAGRVESIDLLVEELSEFI